MGAEEIKLTAAVREASVALDTFPTVIVMAPALTYKLYVPMMIIILSSPSPLRGLIMGPAY